MNVVTIPPRPPDGYNEIVATYGDPRISIVGNKWCVERQWESANLVTIHHPLLPVKGPDGVGKLYVHRLIAEPMLLLLGDWQELGGYPIHTLGCFNPRAQRGGSKPSAHTWAIAFDLNADQNPLVVDCELDDPRRTAPGATDIPTTWSAAAIARGFFHGANFSHRFDPQHFQLCTGY